MTFYYDIEETPNLKTSFGGQGLSYTIWRKYSGVAKSLELWISWIDPVVTACLIIFFYAMPNKVKQKTEGSSVILDY